MNQEYQCRLSESLRNAILLKTHELFAYRHDSKWPKIMEIRPEINLKPYIVICFEKKNENYQILSNIHQYPWTFENLNHSVMVESVYSGDVTKF